MIKKLVLVLMGLVLLAGSFILWQMWSQWDRHGGRNSAQEQRPGESVLYYTCGMHPSVHVTVQEYARGSTQCPICKMDLVPVSVEKDFMQADVKDAKEVIAPTRYYGCCPDKDKPCPRCVDRQTGKECACPEHTFVAREGEGITRCPICGEELKPLPPEESARMGDVIGKLTIKGEQLALAGVASAPLQKRALYKEIRAVGKVAFDPVLAVTQQEYLSAVKASESMAHSDIAEVRERAAQLQEASRKKLLLLGLGEKQIADLAAGGEVQDNLVLPEKTMWIYGEIYEYESSWIRPDMDVQVTAESLPGRVLNGRIDSVDPVVDVKTRTLRFRALVENPDLELKPEMYVDVRIFSKYISPSLTDKVLALPKEALLDTGVRKVVWVDKGEGVFEGRKVVVGPLAVMKDDESGQEYYPVLDDLNEGERVVTRANFLLDSQSRISGAASAAYGGSLGEKEGEAAPAGGMQGMPGMSGHQH